MHKLEDWSSEKVLGHLEAIIRHKEYVRESCIFLAKKLIKLERYDIALKLVQAGYAHDNSKFNNLEFLYLNKNGNGLFEAALTNHVHNNSHHVEYWGEFSNMPEIAIAELAVDWLSRSQEFGSDVKDYIEETAIKKYSINKKSIQYKWLIYYIDLLLEDRF